MPKTSRTTAESRAPRKSWTSTPLSVKSLELVRLISCGGSEEGVGLRGELSEEERVCGDGKLSKERGLQGMGGFRGRGALRRSRGCIRALVGPSLGSPGSLGAA